MEQAIVRIVCSTVFILISQLGLTELYKVCNRHFDQIDIRPQTRNILNSLSRDFAFTFKDVREQALKLLGDREQIYSLLACNLVNIEPSEPLMKLIDDNTQKLDVISVVIIRLRKGLQMKVAGDAFHGLLKYYLVLDGDVQAHITTHSNSYVLATRSSFILDSALPLQVSNPSDNDLIVLCLEISKPFTGYDEMINVIAMQCISSHEETQEKCLQKSLNE